jgi:predicted DNA-binding protein
MSNGDKKQAAARIDEEKYNKIRAHAASQGKPLADWLREAIDEKAEREGVELGNRTPRKIAQTAD